MFLAVANTDTLLVPLLPRPGHEIERACVSVRGGLLDGYRSLRYVTVAQLRLLRIELPCAGKISARHRPNHQHDRKYLDDERPQKVPPCHWAGPPSALTHNNKS